MRPLSTVAQMMKKNARVHPALGASTTPPKATIMLFLPSHARPHFLLPLLPPRQLPLPLLRLQRAPHPLLPRNPILNPSLPHHRYDLNKNSLSHHHHKPERFRTSCALSWIVTLAS